MAVTTAIITAIGVGVASYSAYSSGKTQQSIAEYNAHQQEQDAATQLAALQAQAAVEEKTAAQNLAIQQSYAAAREQNAKDIESQAYAQDAINRANYVKQREEYASYQGQQRANIAASGVVESVGTPLDLLARTAEKIQQDAEETHYTNELSRRTLFSEAAQERLGGQLALAGATLDYNSSVTTAALTRATGDAAYKSSRNQAEITRLTGSSAAKAGTLNAAGTLLSGAGSTYSQYMQNSGKRYKTS